MDILDGRADPTGTEPTATKVSAPPPDVGEEEDQEPDEDDEESASSASEEDIVISEDDEQPPPQALDQLQKFVTDLDELGSKRKTPAADSVEERPKKRRMLKEQTKLGEENEFRAFDNSVLFEIPVSTLH